MRTVTRALTVLACLAGIERAAADPVAVTPVAVDPAAAEPVTTSRRTASRLSLAPEAAAAAWQRPGFRLQLGIGYGRMEGLDGAPSGRTLGPLVRFGARLDRDWSLMGSFQYLSASGDGGLSGLRFVGTLEPTWHVTPSLGLAFGIGFGGLVEGPTGRDDPDPPPGTLVESFTFPDASSPLPSCSGVGVAGLVRVDWLYVLGPRASTGLQLEGSGQWTGCVDDTGRVEPDTAQAIVRRQWWPHVGVTLAWVIAWR